MPEIERDGEELPRLSPGVGCDSTAQGDKVTRFKHTHLSSALDVFPCIPLHPLSACTV